MPKIIECTGCGAQINADIDNVHPQGAKENYCRTCNKKYPEFLKQRQAIWTKYDKLKWDDTAEMRRKIFGKAESVSAPVVDEVEDIKSRVGK